MAATFNQENALSTTDGKWFRMHAESRNNEKLQSKISGELYRHWANLGCLYAEKKQPITVEAFAWDRRITPKQAKAILEKLHSVKLLDRADQGYTPHDWNHWQPEEQSKAQSSTQRTANYRARVRAQGGKVHGYLPFREQVLARDRGACVYCGGTNSIGVVHVIPVSLGGDDHVDNLAATCRSCSGLKAGRSPKQSGLRISPGSPYESIYVANVKRFHTSHETVSRRFTSSHETVSHAPAIVHKPPVLDDFPQFLEVITDADLPCSDTDIQEARVIWVKLDFEQKARAIAGIRQRMENGEWDDPAYRPLPQNYLGKRMYNRQLRPKAMPNGKAGVPSQAMANFLGVQIR